MMTNEQQDKPARLDDRPVAERLQRDLGTLLQYLDKDPASEWQPEPTASDLPG